MKYLIIIISSLLFVNCEKDNRCFDRPGKMETRVESIDSDFSELNLYDDLNYYLINDSLDFVEITGGKNLIQNVQIFNQNGVMEIFNSNKCLFVSNNDAVDITIHYSTMEELGLFGYGDVSSIDAITHNLKVFGENCYSTIDIQARNDSTTLIIEGAPQVSISGSTDYIYAYTVGKGNYFLENLNAYYAHAHNKGIGDIHIKADSSYIIELRSRGDIFIYDTLHTDRFITIDGEGSIFYP